MIPIQLYDFGITSGAGYVGGCRSAGRFNSEVSNSWSDMLMESATRPASIFTTHSSSWEEYIVMSEKFRQE